MPNITAITIHLISNKNSNVKGEAFNVGLTSANKSKLELCELIKKFIPSFDIKLSNFRCDPDKRNYIVSNDKIHKTGFGLSASIFGKNKKRMNKIIEPNNINEALFHCIHQSDAMDLIEHALLSNRKLISKVVLYCFGRFQYFPGCSFRNYSIFTQNITSVSNIK